MIRIPVLIVLGLLSAPLIEILSMVWMGIAPLRMDLTAYYFLMVVLPVALLLHFVMALVGWKAFEPDPKVGAAVYLGTHLLAQTALLAILGNPVPEIAIFALVLLMSGSLVLFVFNRYFWCPQCLGPI